MTAPLSAVRMAQTMAALTVAPMALMMAALMVEMMASKTVAPMGYLKVALTAG